MGIPAIGLLARNTTLASDFTRAVCCDIVKRLCPMWRLPEVVLLAWRRVYCSPPGSGGSLKTSCTLTATPTSLVTVFQPGPTNTVNVTCTEPAQVVGITGIPTECRRTHHHAIISQAIQGTGSAYPALFIQKGGGFPCCKPNGLNSRPLLHSLPLHGGGLRQLWRGVHVYGATERSAW